MATNNFWRTFLCGTVLAAVTQSALAQTPRVFVSVNGNDSNACANVATPCRSFSGALTQVDAGGLLIVLDSGNYGAIDITKAVTISAPSGILAYTHFTVSINAPGAKVVLKGLTVDGATGKGIDVTDVGTLIMEDCVISNATGDGVFIVPPEGGSSAFAIRNSIVRNCGGTGISVGLGTHGSVERARISGNAVGLLAYEGAQVVVRDSSITANSANGIGGTSLGAAVDLAIDGCLVSDNGGTGIWLVALNVSGPIMRVSNTTITHNLRGVWGGGTAPHLLSRGNNTLEGNGTDGAFTGTYLAK
jgi:hypothetical protein